MKTDTERKSFMNMFDEARSIAGMMSLCGMSQSEIAKKMGVSQSYVANKLRLLKFDGETQARITEAGLTERHARALLRLEGERLQRALEEVIARGLNVAETEALADFYHCEEAPKIIKNATRVGRIDAFMTTLTRSLDMLTSLGVDAKKTVGHHGTKTYVTICIDER